MNTSRTFEKTNIIGLMIPKTVEEPQDQGVVALIRRVLHEEKSKIRHGQNVEWVLQCPYCLEWVGGLVEHVKRNHKDKNSRQIRSQCPYEDCGKMVVDVKNHIRKVHDKVKNYNCEQCHATFFSNYQTVKHVETVHDFKKIKCEDCGGLFKSNTLKNHVNRVHRGIKSSISCTEENCTKVFGSHADLERHVEGVHKKLKASCPECGKRMKLQCLPKHIKAVHNGLYKLNCKQCGLGCQNEKQLEKHIRVKHQGTFLYCKAKLIINGGECSKIMHSEEGLIKHTQNEHMDDENVLCLKCNISFPPFFLIHHNAYVHKRFDSVKCVVKECDDSFATYSEFRQHVETVHNLLGLDWCHDCHQFVIQLSEHEKLQHEPSLDFQPVFGVCSGIECVWEDCAYMARDNKHLSNHIYAKHEKKTKIPCKECGKKVSDIQKHINVFHEKVKTFECNVCYKLFLNTSQLKHHMKIHTAIKETCKQCGVSVAHMKQHVRFVHEKDLPYQCFVTNCETKFTSNISFRKHLESVHLMRREVCPLCQKTFSDLKKHTQLVHDKIRNHQCPQCQKNFQTRTHVKNHYNRVHLGFKEQCPECDKMVQDVRNHVNFVHKKVANFGCAQCETKCISNTALQKHVSNVHRKKEFKGKNVA